MTIVDLGEAYVQCKEIDEAARLFGDASELAAGNSSARLIERFKQGRAQLQPWKHITAVRQLDDRLASYGVVFGNVTGHHEDLEQQEDAVVRAAVRVFLLDDHEVVRCGLRELLEHSGDIEVVGEAARVDEALRRIPAVRPDVAVLDARLPDGSGIEVCREIRSSLPSVACLILTSYDDDEALFTAIMAGAAGYVLKQIRGTDLVDAIRRVARGQSLLDPAVTANVLTRLREGPPATDPRFEALSDRERAVLALITDGLSNREIGARLYLAEKTVKNHVSRLLAKLQMQRRTQVAVFGATMRDQGALRPRPHHPKS